MGNRLRISVLMGGPSSEREVSLRSGAAVVAALSSIGHEVVPLDIRSEDGRELDGLACDVAFLALHGRFGEDGTVQKILEGKRIPYTGSGPESSALAKDKIESKRRFCFRGVETPPHRVISVEDPPDLLYQCARALGFPVVVKPRAEGSSIGVTIHPDRSTLEAGAAGVFRYGPVALMEKFIAGKEMTVGILDGRALPIVEIRPRREFFDYEAKYSDEGTQYIPEPPLSDLDAKRISQTALRAYQALQCEGMARVDLILSPLQAAYVLEVNTIPGMTPRSLLPKAARATGIEFPELCQQIVEIALRKKQRGIGGWAAAML